MIRVKARVPPHMRGMDPSRLNTREEPGPKGGASRPLKARPTTSLTQSSSARAFPRRLKPRHDIPTIAASRLGGLRVGGC